MKKTIKRVITFMLIIALMCSVKLVNNKKIKADGYGLKNPRIDETIENITTTWDCIYFGNYYQSNSSTKERIKWRVLSVDGNDAFIMSDVALDGNSYNDDYTGVTWETSTLRNWLNSSFYNNAFSASEKNAIKTTLVVNENNPNYNTDGGGNTSDKVYLLSMKEATTRKYGFSELFDKYTWTRTCKATQYAINNDVWTYSGDVSQAHGDCVWWLRSPGERPNIAASCDADGRGYDDDRFRIDYISGIRPVLHLDLSSSEWSKAGEVSCVDDKEIGKYRTSTESVLGKDLNGILESLATNFKGYLNTIDKSKNIIIPGIEQTNQLGKACNDMVPQGVCVTNKYILISAYDKSNHNSHSSVIYVKERTSGKYLKTLILRDKSHAGALAWDKKGTVYVAGKGERVYLIKTTDIDNSKIDDAVEIPVSEIRVPKHPSFLAYHGGYLYIGQMKDTSNGSNVLMYKCNKNGSIYDKVATSLPNRTQGINFYTSKDGDYLITSTSIGRNNDSLLQSYKTNFNSTFAIKLQETKNELSLPCMSEDLDISNGLLYTCFESAANFYRLGTDGKGISSLPIDRVLCSNINAIVSWDNNKKSKNYKSDVDNDFDIVVDGECGESSNYRLYDDGTLMVSGSGSVYDYSNYSETPWSSYSNQITNIVIGADISSIGNNSFSNLVNLKKVVFSQMLNDQEVFYIKNNSFKNCSNLEVINMPNVDFSISNNSFDGCSKLQIRTDSKSVSDYCRSKSISIHNHDFKYKSTLTPTCIDDGYDLYKCDCGEEELRNITQATNNHKYSLTRVNINSKIYTCEHCGSQYEVENENASNKGTSAIINKQYKSIIINKRTTLINKIKSKKKALKIIWKRVNGINGYQIQCSLKKNFKKKTKTITIRKASTNSKTIKKLKRKKKYYVRIRTFILVNGKPVYSAWSKAKSKKTK